MSRSPHCDIPPAFHFSKPSLAPAPCSVSHTGPRSQLSTGHPSVWEETGAQAAWPGAGTSPDTLLCTVLPQLGGPRFRKPFLTHGWKEPSLTRPTPHVDTDRRARPARRTQPPPLGATASAGQLVCVRKETFIYRAPTKCQMPCGALYARFSFALVSLVTVSPNLGHRCEMLSLMA